MPSGSGFAGPMDLLENEDPKPSSSDEKSVTSTEGFLPRMVSHSLIVSYKDLSSGGSSFSAFVNL